MCAVLDLVWALWLVKSGGRVLVCTSTKLAHQFWFSYPPPGAGGAGGTKDKQAQGEEQEQNKRTTREQRQQGLDAAIKVPNYIIFN